MKLEKILSRIAIIVTIALLIFAIWGGFAIYDYLFPMADMIVCPKEEDVTSISLTQNNGTNIAIEKHYLEDFLQYIRNAKPTRKWSVHDSPVAENYYIIELDTHEREYRYFVYVENSLVYIERPYDGVYRGNQQLLDFLDAFFND